MTHSIELDQLLIDGFTRKFGAYYAQSAKREKQIALYNQDYVDWAHAHGFLAESAYAYGLNENNYKDYFSDYDYFRLFPLNDWTKIWINDKLTLKYMLVGTEYESFMPRYYYYNTFRGLRTCCDAPNKDKAATAEDFIQLLSDCGEFACKPNNGSTSTGFFRAYLDGNNVVMNGQRIPFSQVEDELKKYPNYLFTEYIRPSAEFAAYSPAIHTIRIVIVNESGYDPRIIGGYFRIPNKLSGDANYIILSDHADQYNVTVDLDFETGSYGNAKMIYLNRVQNTLVHPDSGAVIKGCVPNFDYLKETVLGIAKHFNTIEYMGFDIGVTEKGIRCMEINSHPGIKYMQIYRSLFSDPLTKEYYMKKKRAIDDMSCEEKNARNALR